MILIAQLEKNIISMKKNIGFTLIELLIVVAIVGILTSIALPGYQGFTVRVRIIDGLSLASSAKKAIAVDGIASQFDLDLAVSSWNRRANNLGATSKYVSSVLFPPVPNSTGMITITYRAGAVGLGVGQNTLILAPYIQTGIVGNQPTLVAAILAGNRGPIDWACTSSSNLTAVSQGMPAPLGTVPSQFAPTQCR